MVFLKMAKNQFCKIEFAQNAAAPSIQKKSSLAAMRISPIHFISVGGGGGKEVGQQKVERSFETAAALAIWLSAIRHLKERDTRRYLKTQVLQANFCSVYELRNTNKLMEIPCTCCVECTHIGSDRMYNVSTLRECFSIHLQMYRFI